MFTRIEVPLGQFWTGASAHPKAQEEWADLLLIPSEAIEGAFNRGITAGRISSWFSELGWSVFGQPLADWFEADSDSYRILEMDSCDEIIYQDEWQVVAVNATFHIRPVADAAEGLDFDEFCVQSSLSNSVEGFHSEPGQVKDRQKQTKEVLMNDRKSVRLYTDGACSGNPGPGGWCAILQYNGRERIVRGGEAHTTNNRMELTAIIGGLVALKEPCCVTVFTDSEYAVGLMTLSWKRKANLDLLHELDALCVVHEVEFEHVRGHAGHPMNERADRLAKAEARKQRSKANLDGTQCVGCGGLATKGVFCQSCRSSLSDHELDQVWREHCLPLPSGYEQKPDVVYDMAP